MLSTVRIFGQAVGAEVDATRAAYARWMPYHCDCCYCRNVRAQWQKIVREDVRSALASLGIDPEKPGEIVDFGRQDKAGRLCEVEWPFLGTAGENAPGGDPGAPRVNSLVVYPGGIPCGEEFATDSRWSASLLLEGVPWVLDEAEPEP